jgi:predicted CopG family antitoxin
MVKVIKISDDNYAKLLEILHEIEKKQNSRMSFDDVVSYLIKCFEERVGKNLKINKVT